MAALRVQRVTVKCPGPTGSDVVDCVVTRPGREWDIAQPVTSCVFWDRSLSFYANNLVGTVPSTISDLTSVRFGCCGGVVRHALNTCVDFFRPPKHTAVFCHGMSAVVTRDAA